MKNCPISKKELKKATFYNVEIDYCPECLGIWFDEDELRLAKDSKDGGLKWMDIDLWKDKRKFRISKGSKMCPSCRLPLYEVGYGDSEVKVDVCNICKGVWLDRGEFKQIISYLRKRADWNVLNNYAKSLKEEALEIFIGPETIREEIEDFLTVLKMLNYKLLTQYPKISRIMIGLPK